MGRLDARGDAGFAEHTLAGLGVGALSEDLDSDIAVEGDVPSAEDAPIGALSEQTCDAVPARKFFFQRRRVDHRVLCID